MNFATRDKIKVFAGMDGREPGSDRDPVQSVRRRPGNFGGGAAPPVRSFWQGSGLLGSILVLWAKWRLGNSLRCTTMLPATRWIDSTSLAARYPRVCRRNGRRSHRYGPGGPHVNYRNTLLKVFDVGFKASFGPRGMKLHRTAWGARSNSRSYRV